MVHVQKHVEMVFRHEHDLVRSLHLLMVVTNVKEKALKKEIVK